jgi:hypothetical protein
MKIVRFLFNLIGWSICLLAFSFLVLSVLALVKFIW